MLDRQYERNIALLFLGIVCVSLLWTIRPRLLHGFDDAANAPGLILDIGALDALAAQERTQGRKDAVDEDLKKLFLAQGRAEIEGDVSDQVPKERARNRQEVLSKMPAHARAAALSALCRWATLAFDEKWKAGFDVDQSLWGRFGDSLRLYGVLRGSHLGTFQYRVARTLFKARCNIMFDRSPEEGFAPCESAAYHGWMAVHGDSAPMASRLDALDRMVRLRTATSPVWSEIVRASLLDRSAQYLSAAGLWQRLYQKTGWLWLRNHAFSSMVQLQQKEDTP